MTQTAETSETDKVDRTTFLRPPSACWTEFEQVPWIGSLAVRLEGDKHVGVRFNDARLMAAVADRLGTHLADTGDDYPAYYSVKLNSTTRRRKAPLHYVYLGTRPVVGTRDVTRLLDGLAAHLGHHLVSVTDRYTSSAAPVLTPTGVMLVPGDLMLMSKVADRVLRPEGFVVAEVPLIHLDLEAGVVMVPEAELSLKLDRETLAELPQSEPEARLAPGRYPITRWLMPVGAEEAGPLSHARAVLYGTRLLKTPFPHGAQAAIDDVARMTEHVPAHGVTWASDEELVRAVLRAGRA